MALIFPNRSRSFDETRRTVRFLGYDGMFEVPFAVQASALLGSASSADIEADCLAAFDALRDRIYAVAQRVYTRGRGTTITTITPADFR